MRFNRIYPEGDEMNFDGEGEGTTYRASYDWQTNGWYRFVLHTWDDNKTKNTFIGQWIQDLSTLEWTLFAYFNTNLKNSYIIGGLSQFQENFNAKYFGVERSFQIKNMYAYDRSYKKWISLNSSRLSFDPPEWNYDTAGTHEIGYTNDYFYGSSGLPVDDQKVYDSKHPAIVGTIKQPNTPNFIQPTFKLLLATITSTKLTVEWQITTNTCPCYEYIITIQQSSNSQYKTIHTYTTSRPEQKTYTYTSSFKGTYKIGVKANAISGTQVYKEITKTI